jgi:hypothetical protein
MAPISNYLTTGIESKDLATVVGEKTIEDINETARTCISCIRPTTSGHPQNEIIDCSLCFQRLRHCFILKEISNLSIFGKIRIEIGLFFSWSQIRHKIDNQVNRFQSELMTKAKVVPISYYLITGAESKDLATDVGNETTDAINKIALTCIRPTTSNLSQKEMIDRSVRFQRLRHCFILKEKSNLSIFGKFWIEVRLLFDWTQISQKINNLVNSFNLDMYVSSLKPAAPKPAAPKPAAPKPAAPKPAAPKPAAPKAIETIIIPLPEDAQPLNSCYSVIIKYFEKSILSQWVGILDKDKALQTILDDNHLTPSLQTILQAVIQPTFQQRVLKSKLQLSNDITEKGCLTKDTVMTVTLSDPLKDRVEVTLAGSIPKETKTIYYTINVTIIPGEDKLWNKITELRASQSVR